MQGCAASLKQKHTDRATPVAQVPSGRLNFAWKLSGDRTVAPIQVFSDHNSTWLHWQPNQLIPAIVAEHEGQELVLPYKRQDPYTIVEGLWPRLIFRAGHQQAQARRVQSVSESSQSPLTPKAVDHRPPVVESASTTATFAVTTEDQHVRQALVRWSGLSGWSFQPEHWGVDVDIPLSAGARFSDDFIGSVQALLSSTELSDRPLQPCFYSNQVLRVIPVAEPCDRTAVSGTDV